MRKQDRNHHIWASGGSGVGSAGHTGCTKALEEQGWCRSLLALVVPEGVNPTPRSAAGVSHAPVGSWDELLLLGHAGSAGSSAPAQRTKGLKLCRTAAPSPSPSSALHILCLGSRPHTSLICEVSLPGPLAPSAPSSVFLPASKEERWGWGPTPSLGCSWEGRPGLLLGEGGVPGLQLFRRGWRHCLLENPELEAKL